MNLSDAIEDFILNVMGQNPELVLSRNELAEHFNVAPSQINYVLATRFSLPRGYIVDSKRGKGGNITIIRIFGDAKDIITQIVEEVSRKDSLTFVEAMDYMTHLLNSRIITEDEYLMFKRCIRKNWFQPKRPFRSSSPATGLTTDGAAITRMTSTRHLPRERTSFMM